MAVINIKFSCGCGFIHQVTVTKDPEIKGTQLNLKEVIDHVEKTGHTISSIVGTIKPTIKPSSYQGIDLEHILLKGEQF